MSKHTTVNAVLLQFVLSSSLLVGCGEDDQAPEDKLEDSLNTAQRAVDDAGDQIEALRDESDRVQDRIETSRDELRETRGELAALWVSQLNEWDSRSEGLRERVTRLPAESEQTYQGRLDELQSQLAGVRDRLSNFADSDAGQESWEEVKEAVEALNARYEAFVSDLNGELAE